MTSGLLLGAVVVSVLPQRTHMLRRGAPTLVLILGYFGLGSIALSSEILLRFHAAIPDETETQFVSGLGHLVEAAVGIALLIPFARRHTMTDWLWAHTVALTYWTFQVAVLTPPWFAFQGQREAVLHVVLVMLAVAAPANVLLWTTAARRRSPTPERDGSPPALPRRRGRAAGAARAPRKG